MKTLIIVTTLRIGGIERNALDQAYQISDDNDSSIILVLDKINNYQNVNFLNLESQIISRKNIDIRFCDVGFRSQIKTLIQLLTYENLNLVIDNTLSGTLKTRIASIIARKKIVIHAVVQQLASLSAPTQRYKRMFYAQFATTLFINSVNYGIDWTHHKNRYLLSKILFRKKFHILRNGVYIDRLPRRIKVDETNNVQHARFIFLGRLKSWKGINKLNQIDEMTNKREKFLIVASEFDDKITFHYKKLFGDRIEFIFGKTLSSFTPAPGDIHIYPVDYGENPPAIESVSTNCLEMAMIGVPSMVTKGGTNNWSELRHMGVVKEVDWDNSEELNQVLNQCKHLYVTEKNLKDISELIDIKNNLRQHKLYSGL
jgi:hypothetical protein